MMTKRELAEELIKLGVEGTVESLKRDNTLKQLEDMLEDAKSNKEPKQAINSEIDIEELKKQMLAEAEAKLRAEFEEKMNAEKKQEKSHRVSQIDRHKMIPIMSVTSGKLVYVSPRSGMKVVWMDYGDIEYLEMQEVQTMRTSNRSFLNEPFAIVLDDDVANYLGLDKLYEKIDNLQNIDDIFKMKQEDFENVVNNSPSGIQILIVNRASELIRKGEFDSGRKINFLNEKFDTDLIVV